MKRRKFLGWLGGGVVAAPLLVKAEPGFSAKELSRDVDEIEKHYKQPKGIRVKADIPDVYVKSSKVLNIDEIAALQQKIWDNRIWSKEPVSTKELGVLDFESCMATARRIHKNHKPKWKGWT